MKVILTGATGFLGSHFLADFIRENFKVIIIKRKSTNLELTFQQFGELEAWDVEQLEDLFVCHPDVGAIIHAATDYGYDDTNPTAPFLANEAFPMKLLSLAIQHKIATFINIDTFFSSQHVVYEHLSAYTLSKRHFKEWGQYCANVKKIGFSNLQIFHLYGPGDSYKKFVPSMVARCLKGGEIDLTDGIQERDFIYISDAVSALKVILRVEVGREPEYRHYDIGTGSPLCIRDFMEKVKHLCSSSANLNFGALPSRKGEFQSSCADTTALRSLGWVPRVGIEAGIQSVVDDVKQRAIKHLL
jgi:CDP-paratose synthetase